MCPSRLSTIRVHYRHVVAAHRMIAGRHGHIVVVTIGAARFARAPIFAGGVAFAFRSMVMPRRRPRPLAIPRDQRRIELVGGIPGDGVPLERRHHLRERRAELVHWLPIKKLPRAADIEDIMVVARLDHPRLDFAVLAQKLVLHPGTCLGDRLWNPKRVPALPAQRAADDVLDFGIAKRFRLADEQRQFDRQLIPAVDQPRDRIGQILEMDEGLTSAEHARIKVRGQPVLIDPGDLLRDEGLMAFVLIDTGDPQKDDRDAPMTLTEHRLGTHLGFGVGPARVDRRLFSDALVRAVGRPVDEHRAGKDELPDLEGL